MRYNGEKYKLDYAVTKKQKDILAAFEMNTEYFIQKSNKISELLQNELSMKDDLEEEEDGQEENDCFDWSRNGEGKERTKKNDFHRNLEFPQSAPT